MIILSFLNQSLHLTPRPLHPQIIKTSRPRPRPLPDNTPLSVHTFLIILLRFIFSPDLTFPFLTAFLFFSKKMFIIKITISNVKNLTPLISFLVKSYPRDWISTCAAYNSFAFYGSSWYGLHHFTGGTRKNLQLIKAVVQICPKTARSCSPLNLL